MTTRSILIGGNWKSNGSLAKVKSMANALKEISWDTQKVTVVLAPPYPYLESARKEMIRQIHLAGQNCSSLPNGPYTGEISAEMLKDIGADWVIVGHSERRSLFQESDEVVGKKLKSALDIGLNVILCIGETLSIREKNETLSFLKSQLFSLLPYLKCGDGADKGANGDLIDLSKFVIAYEPIWAIGTGKVASPDQAQEVHKSIRSWISENLSPTIASVLKIIYGGSVSSKNCQSLICQPDVDGFLVGGASLVENDFTQIIKISEENFASK